MKEASPCSPDMPWSSASPSSMFWSKESSPRAPSCRHRRRLPEVCPPRSSTVPVDSGHAWPRRHALRAPGELAVLKDPSPPLFASEFVEFMCELEHRRGFLVAGKFPVTKKWRRWYQTNRLGLLYRTSLSAHLRVPAIDWGELDPEQLAIADVSVTSG